jgi:quinol-cytochrome oxidoreductase complex cytochrome b subunit
MATVITSLATVIPVVGKTVLSYLWGGFQQKASLKKTLLNAETGKLSYCITQY